MEIGMFKIERQDVDYVLVTRTYSEGIYSTVKICGGDMETFLNGLFLGGETTHVMGDRVTVSKQETIKQG